MTTGHCLSTDKDHLTWWKALEQLLNGPYEIWVCLINVVDAKHNLNTSHSLLQVVHLHTLQYHKYKIFKG